VANLALGLRYRLRFAADVGAVTAEEAEGLWRRGWEALGEAAMSQIQHQVAQEPTRRFLELLSAAIASGRAHVANPEGEIPKGPKAWGWRISGEEWRPKGERVGWVHRDDLYLEPEAAFAATQRQGRDAGDPLSVSGRTFNKRLHERGLLSSNEAPHLTVRRVLQGERRRVLHLSADVLSYPQEKVGNVGHGIEEPLTHAENRPPLWTNDGGAGGPPGDPLGKEVGHGPSTGPSANGGLGHDDHHQGAPMSPDGPNGPVPKNKGDGDHSGDVSHTRRARGRV
jgi:hypothetical protein